MESKFSQTRRSAEPAGSLKSVRYHQETANGLSGEHRVVGEVLADEVVEAGEGPQVHSEIGVGKLTVIDERGHYRGRHGWSGTSRRDGTGGGDGRHLPGNFRRGLDLPVELEVDAGCGGAFRTWAAAAAAATNVNSRALIMSFLQVTDRFQGSIAGQISGNVR